MAAFLSSGDVIMDSRLEWARSYWQAGEPAAAIDLLSQTLASAPQWAAGYFQLGDWYRQASLNAQAVTAWRQYLALDPTDSLGASVKLALIGVVPMPDQLPKAYVTHLFDDYAPRFDTALLDRLDYQVPGQLHEAVRHQVADDHLFSSVLDLGCGTGLAGQWIRPQAARLVGVDLSAGMLHEARRKDLYDDLVETDAVAFLAGKQDRFDLILAADVLVYMGDLKPLFAALAQGLAPGGLFVASTEALLDRGDFVLTSGHRFLHSQNYLRTLCQENGLDLLALDPLTCRTEAGRDVAGWRLVVRNPAINPARENKSQPNRVDGTAIARTSILSDSFADPMLPLKDMT